MARRTTCRRSILAITFTVLLIACAPIATAQDAAPSPATLTASFASLKAHISGSAELTAEQINAHTTTIKDHASLLATSPTLLKTAFDLLATYDQKHKPLWIGHKELNSKKTQPGDEIHWAIFWLMQSIVDEVYTPAGVAQLGPALQGLRFASADHFPGKVDEPISLQPYTVKINASYPVTWGSPIFGSDLPARKPTGAYLAPGSIVTVHIPDALVNKGYQIRVGAHSWDMTRKPRVLRLYRVSAVYDIDKPQIQIANPLGGGIYIEVPYKSDAGIVEITIHGAARSPYFSFKNFDKTSVEQWRNVERNRKAPWADFQSDKFMMQVPTSWIYKLDDPVTLMQDPDKSMDIVNDLMGRPHDYGRETLYCQVDRQLRGNAFHPGYPSVNRGYDPTQDYGGYHDNHLVRGPQFAHSYEFHELGHGMLFPKYDGDREAAVNLLHVPVMARGFGVDLQRAFADSRSSNNPFHTLENTAVAWMMCDHFVDGSGMAGYERQYQLKGHAKFVDVARLFGWEALGRFWKAGHQAFMDGKPWPQNASGEECDDYTLNLSLAAGADLRPLITFWGIPIVNAQKSDEAFAAAGLKPSAKVYDLLLSYKNLIPADNAAIRTFAQNWWGKQPSEKGFTEERNHAVRWEAYDQDAAKAAHQAMQKILDRYFPQGRPD